MQYVDIVQWQTDLLESDETKACRDFWRDHSRKLDMASLASTTLPLELNSDTSDFLPRVLSSSVDPTILHHLDRTCSQQSISTSDFILACWAALLSRLTGHPQMILGCELDGRKFEELEQTIGLFAKYIPLQIQVEPALPFTSLLRNITESVAELNQWQEGFTWSHIESSSDSSGPILPLAFDYVETGEKQIFGDLSLTITRQYVSRERSKLRLSAVRSATGLTLEFHYDASHLERSSVELISTYFHTLLAAALERPETPVSQLPLLTQSERNRLLVEWNQTAAIYPKHECLHQLFETQVERTPNRPALRFNEQTLSYRELNEQANQLAHYLRTLGVGPDSLVGLCLNRSTGLMVALLGVLKAGGAYVPLNAATPKPRLAQQLASASVLITEQNLLALVPEFTGNTILLDSQQSLWTNQLLTNPAVQTTPENLVYVLYTSGSTGVPKGVTVRHRNLVNYAHFITQRLHLDRYPDGLHFATVSTLAADLGNTCIYPSLISGCLHVISYEVATDAESLAHYNTQHPIDVLKIVPSHLQALLHAPDAKRILPHAYLITGGEALLPKWLRRS